MEDKYIGKKYNMLTIISKDINKKDCYWCECECGNIKSIRIYSLKNNRTKSCGCKPYKKKGNIYDLSGEYGIGYTLKNKPFYFDLKNYDKIKEYTWRLNPYNYVLTRMGNKMVYMHRFIMDCPKDMEIDHINGNGTENDNRESNLRACNRQENMKNIKRNGYSYDKNRDKWQVKIRNNGESINIGRFNTEEEAKIARREAELKYFGEFAPKIGENNIE